MTDRYTGLEQAANLRARETDTDLMNSPPPVSLPRSVETGEVTLPVLSRCLNSLSVTTAGLVLIDEVAGRKTFF